MRRIAIVGSGQGGLQLAFGLLSRGYAVTLYSDRTPEKWLNNSRPNGTAFLFDQATQNERDPGLNLWEESAPHGEGIRLTFLQEVGEICLIMSGPLDTAGQAVDQRRKFADRLKEFEKQEGQLVTKTVTYDDLEPLAESHDLVVIAAGKGDITYQLFGRDAEWSVYDEHQRNLAMITVTNTKPWPDVAFHPIQFSSIAPAGELFWMPFFDKSQVPSYSMVFKNKSGGPMDRFVGQVKSGQEVVETGKDVIRYLVPWYHEHLKDATLSDDLAWLTGKFPLTVRKRVGRLPSGKAVMVLGDTAVTYDPIAAQRANSASKMAQHVLQQIV